MRFMIIVKANAESEAGVLPPPEVFEAMGRFNQHLIDAGVLLAADGLHPSSRGARVRLEDGRPRVLDGPFAETRELIAGYWTIGVRSREEAIAWAVELMSEVPFEEGEEIEIRQVFEAADFADVLSPEEVAREPARHGANEASIPG